MPQVFRAPWQRCRAGEDAVIPALNHPQAPWISACQDGRPPCQSPLCTLRTELFTQGINDSTEISSLPRLSTHSPLQHRDGRLLLALLLPHPKGLRPSLCKHRGTARRSLLSLCVTQHPAFPAKQTPLSLQPKRCQPFLPVKPHCPDPGKMWSSSLPGGEGAHTQPQHALRTIHGQRP